MRNMCAFVLFVAAAICPQMSFANGTDLMDDAQQWAYQQCSGGKWAEEGYSTFNECTHYKVEEYLINH